MAWLLKGEWSMSQRISPLCRPLVLAHVTTSLVLACTVFAGCNHIDEDTETAAVRTGGASGTPMGGDGGMGPEDCFSPSTPESAYAEGATGCACSFHADQSICIGGAALICDNGGWIFAEDGPCEPRTDECAGTVDTWQLCLAQYRTCSETTDGKFCGRDPLDVDSHERPVCPINYRWSEHCAEYFDGIGSQILEGCGYIWIRAQMADSTRNTIVDAEGMVVFQQWDDPLSTINPRGCLGGEIPDCPDLPDDVSSEWKDVELVQRGDQCLGGAGGSHN
jgi:hypothetical protein